MAQRAALRPALVDEEVQLAPGITEKEIGVAVGVQVGGGKVEVFGVAQALGAGGKCAGGATLRPTLVDPQDILPAPFVDAVGQRGVQVAVVIQVNQHGAVAGGLRVGHHPK